LLGLFVADAPLLGGLLLLLKLRTRCCFTLGHLGRALRLTRLLGLQTLALLLRAGSSGTGALSPSLCLLALSCHQSRRRRWHGSHRRLGLLLFLQLLGSFTLLLLALLGTHGLLLLAQLRQSLAVALAHV